MKLRNTKNVDARQAMAVDSAYLTCKPPERAILRRKKRSPQELYMRHLIMDVLGHDDLKQVGCAARLRDTPLSRPPRCATFSGCRAGCQEAAAVFVGGEQGEAGQVHPLGSQRAL